MGLGLGVVGLGGPAKPTREATLTPSIKIYNLQPPPPLPLDPLHPQVGDCLRLAKNCALLSLELIEVYRRRVRDGEVLVPLPPLPTA